MLLGYKRGQKLAWPVADACCTGFHTRSLRRFHFNYQKYFYNQTTLSTDKHQSVESRLQKSPATDTDTDADTEIVERRSRFGFNKVTQNEARACDERIYRCPTDIKINVKGHKMYKMNKRAAESQLKDHLGNGRASNTLHLAA